jgi:hypothetical protein
LFSYVQPLPSRSDGHNISLTCIFAPRSGLAHFVRQERSDSTKCDKENIRLKQLLCFFKKLGHSILAYTN